MEPTVELYKMQHQRALQCATEIANSNVDAETARTNAVAIRIALAHLAGVLKPHFTSEDRIVYPRLLAHTNSSVAETAKRFWAEMGGVTEAVNDYLETWRKFRAIAASPQEFIAACKALFPALKKRIEAEENELYSMFLDHP